MNNFPLIVGNWKMHKTVVEAKAFLKQLRPHRCSPGVWLAVPFTALAASAHEVMGTWIHIGAQNMAEWPSGAMTGEVSVEMIQETGASFVILGHSERRRLFHEDDGIINRKVKLALENDLKVILCIGETKEERDQGRTEEVLFRQIEGGLRAIPLERVAHVVLAYEPVWAIGVDCPASCEIVEEIHAMCKNYGTNYWKTCHVLYGGSINAKNARDFLRLPNVDGLLVGKASLEVQSFIEIIDQAHESK